MAGPLAGPIVFAANIRAWQFFRAAGKPHGVNAAAIEEWFVPETRHPEACLDFLSRPKFPAKAAPGAIGFGAAKMQCRPINV
jgi:hypothetical protein